MEKVEKQLLLQKSNLIGLLLLRMLRGDIQKNVTTDPTV